MFEVRSVQYGLAAYCYCIWCASAGKMINGPRARLLAPRLGRTPAQGQRGGRRMAGGERAELPPRPLECGRRLGGELGRGG
eukprot:8248537-Lingulodinium_polyedra.AAC.1